MRNLLECCLLSSEDTQCDRRREECECSATPDAMQCMTLSCIASRRGKLSRSGASTICVLCWQLPTLSCSFESSMKSCYWKSKWCSNRRSLRDGSVAFDGDSSHDTRRGLTPDLSQLGFSTLPGTCSRASEPLRRWNRARKSCWGLYVAVVVEELKRFDEEEKRGGEVHL